MPATQHISIAALCLALFSIPLSLAQTTSPTLAILTVTTTTVNSMATTTTVTSMVPSPTVVPGYGDWSYYGCYNETTGNPSAGNVRALVGNNTASDDETISMCLVYCQSQSEGFAYAGLEYGRECYCGPNINTGSQKLGEDKCEIPCKGDNTEICGGLLALTVYKRNTTDSKSAATSLSHMTDVCFGLAARSLLAVFGIGLVML